MNTPGPRTKQLMSRSILDYAIPVWSPFLSDTKYSKLQTVQNNTLRIADSCVKMTALLTKQCLAAPIVKPNELFPDQCNIRLDINSY